MIDTLVSPLIYASFIGIFLIKGKTEIVIHILKSKTIDIDL